MVAVVCKIYGLAHMEEAEDFVSEAFLRATETWKHKGIPEHPKAWLYQVAKNLALDSFKRNKTYLEKVIPEIDSDAVAEMDFSEGNINDSQLRMIFAVCNPVNPSDAQLALALRILCGFGIDEIAKALLSTKSTVNKKLFRAKEKLRTEGVKMELPSEKEQLSRLDQVLSVLYLLFNEGYYSLDANEPIRRSLCFDAMRLLLILIENKETNTAEANALLALFCFQASRFDARVDEQGTHILFDDQDKGKWNWELIAKGQEFLRNSAEGVDRGKYQYQAMIAFWHTRNEVDENEKWTQILNNYNRLLQLSYSPVAALSRTYALMKIEGAEIALKEALKINLKESHLYHSLLAEIYSQLDVAKQRVHLKIALGLAQTRHDKNLLESKLRACSER